MEEKKDQFFFQGKFFDNQKDFWDYIEEWNSRDLDQETVDRQLNI